MAYIAPIHRPSSVRHAVSLNLYSADEESLALAKANRLEIWRVADGALKLSHSTAINGTICMLQKLRPKDSPTDLLFVGTDRFQYFTALWNPETDRVEAVQYIHDLGERYMRDSQSQDRCIVDPSGKFMAMHLWEGVLNVMRLLMRGNKTRTLTLECLEQVRLAELFIRASTFLCTETGLPKIAFLYKTQADSRDMKLATYRLTADDRNSESSRFDAMRDRDINMDLPDGGACMLIPVRKVEEEVKRHNVRNPEFAKAHLGGLIVVGETRLLYIDEVTKATVESGLKEAAIFVAWAEYDPTHYFLADDYGAMHMLILHTQGVEVTRMEVKKIGITPRASCLVHLSGGLLFVASHYGDSQLFRVDQRASGGDYLQLVQTLSNVGPILDFTIMDMGNREGDGQLGNEYSSGQARIVTGSGVYKDGSLRSVRSGVGLEDVGILADLESVRAIFPLCVSNDAEKVDTLVASFLTETRVFRFDENGDVEEVESLCGLALDGQTLLASNLPNGRLLQVTPTTVLLLDAKKGAVVASWSPEGADKIITGASANWKWLLLSISGVSLASISLLGSDELRVVEQNEVSEKDQVACVHVAPQLDDIGVVGFWASGTVSIVDMNSLQSLHGESLRKSSDEVSIPRDIALVQTLPPSVAGPTLFVAMEDGNIVTFKVAKDLALSGRKSVVLGTRQARFHLLPRPDGLYNIFATSEHPSLIYGAEGRNVYSAVTAEDATCVCPFDTVAYPDCIMVATASQVKISQIDNERQTHVSTLQMGKMVRRLAYSPKEKVFGLGCIKRELRNGEEVIQSSFELVGEVVFDKLGKPFALETTSYLELVEAVIRAELPDAYGNPAERFIVGTSFVPDPDAHDGDGSKVRGRILIFGVDSDRNPYLIMSHDLKGGCRCLAVMNDDMIVAGLTKTVVVSRYTETSSTSGHLTRLASYRPSTYPVDLAVDGNIIGVGDLMKSLTLVEFTTSSDSNDNDNDPRPRANQSAGWDTNANRGRNSNVAATSGPRLIERARHFQSAWATAVGHVEDDSWLEADAQGNLIVLRRNKAGVTRDDRLRLELTSEINLGEMVNRIRGVAVETGPNAIVIPRAFLGTVEGAIYLFGTIAPHAQDLLMRFQAKLADAVEQLGNIGFRQYRSFRNAEREGDGPFRFVDGELLERFLDLDEATQQDVCQGLGPGVEDMRNLVEELKRIH